MPLVVNCSCGKQLRVPDEFAGKRVKCPACQNPCAVPAAGAPSRTAPATPAGTMISFRCTCGQTMQARAEFAGRKTKCPSCGEVVPIPGKAGTADKLTTAPKKAAPAPPPPEADDREDDEDEAPVRARRKRRPARGSALPWVLAAVGVLLLVGGGVGAFFLFRNKSPDTKLAAQQQSEQPVADLDLIPGNAVGFVMVRLADVLRLEQVQKQLAESLKDAPPGSDPLTQVQQATGSSLSDIDRVTVVLQDTQQGLNGIWVLVSATKPFDQARLTAAVFKGQQSQKVPYGGKTMEVEAGQGPNMQFGPGPGGRPMGGPPGMPMGGPPGRPMGGPPGRPMGGPPGMAAGPNSQQTALCFLNETLLVLGPEVGVKRCLDQLGGKRAAGPLDEAIKRHSEKHHVLLGATPPAEAMAGAANQLPPLLAGLKPLTETRGVTLWMDLGDQVKLDVALRLPDEEKGKAAKTALDGLLGTVKLLLLPSLKSQLAKELPKEAAEVVYKQIQAAVNGIKVEQAGTNVNVAASVDAKAIDDAVKPLLPILAKGGAGSGVGGTAALKHTNNLKQLVLAMHNYADSHGGQFPPAVIYSRDGKPLYSWRVELLPYLEQGQLYTEFKKDEPWDSPHNRRLMARMPAVFRLPGDSPTTTLTPYQVFVGPNTPWANGGRTGPRMPAGFPDGTSNTILIADGAKMVSWTKPEDITLRPGASPKPLLGTKLSPGSFYAALADGQVRKVSLQISDKTLLNAINPADGQILGPDWK